jgi:hypothetical protein
MTVICGAGFFEGAFGERLRRNAADLAQGLAAIPAIGNGAGEREGAPRVARGEAAGLAAIDDRFPRRSVPIGCQQR